MKWIHQLRFLLRPFFGRNRVHQEMDQEFRFHLEMEREKLRAQGMDPETARREASLRFGCVEGLKEEVRDVDGVGWIEKLLSDARFGIRVLRSNPVFAGVAVLTLALGIGASTAIFSLVDGILLRPLPFEDPEELVTVWADLSGIDGPVQEWLSFPNYEDARGSGLFEELGAYFEWQGSLAGDGATQALQGIQLSPEMISTVLGVSPILGRGLLTEDGRDGAPPVALISQGLWDRLFGSDPGVLEMTLLLDGTPYEIVGVMPTGFTFPNLGGGFSAQLLDQEVWLPLQTEGLPQDRGDAFIRTLGRLAPGISVEVARERLLQLGNRLSEEYPEANTGVTYSIFPLQKDMVQAQEEGLWVLLGSVGFILLLVCLNLANLLLARGSARLEEMAVRSALGAGRRRLIRQLVTESTVLAVLGGGLGMLVAYLATDLLVSMAPEGTPRLEGVGVDGRILLFATVVTLGSGLLFGLFPAWRLASGNLQGDLASGSRTSEGRGGARLRSGMVGGQMAVALVLLVGAGLLLQTFRQLSRVDLGYDPTGVAAGFIGLNGDRYPEAVDRIAFVTELEGRVSALPGVEETGIVSTLPLSGLNGDVGFQVEGRTPPPPGQENISWIRRITPGYLGAMRIPILEGRPFMDADNRDQEARVILVNETLAERYFPGETAVGKRLNFGDPDDPTWREIVGVVRNVKNFGLRAGSPNATYFPYAQVPNLGLFITARTTLENPESLIPALRGELAQIDEQIALAQPGTMEGMVSGALAQERFVATLLTLFAGVALFLAAVGLYGVVAYNVALRTREMGLRIALGADGGRITRLVLGKSMFLGVSGLLIGLGGAVALTRFMEGMLFGVRPTDSGVLAVTSGLLLFVAGLASAIPAWRATRVDPARALKAD